MADLLVFNRRREEAFKGAAHVASNVGARAIIGTEHDDNSFIALWCCRERRERLLRDVPAANGLDWRASYLDCQGGVLLPRVWLDAYCELEGGAVGEDAFWVDGDGVAGVGGGEDKH